MCDEWGISHTHPQSRARGAVRPALAGLRLLPQPSPRLRTRRLDGDESHLYSACRRGHAACAQLLIQHKASVDRVSTSLAQTPLFAAAYNGHIDCLRLLLQAQQQSAENEARWVAAAAAEISTPPLSLPADAMVLAPWQPRPPQ